MLGKQRRVAWLYSELLKTVLCPVVLVTASNSMTLMSGSSMILKPFKMVGLSVPMLVICLFNTAYIRERRAMFNTTRNTMTVVLWAIMSTRSNLTVSCNLWAH